MTSNYIAYPEQREEGTKTELTFDELVEGGACLSNGAKIGLVRKATLAEQRNDKVDRLVRITLSNDKTEEAWVEVKGKKKNQRNGKITDDFWLEVVGIAYVKDPLTASLGWLKGKAKFIVFQRGQTFLMFPRADLLDFYNEKAIHPAIAKTWESYKLYQEYFRTTSWKNLTERFAKFPSKDILNLSHWTIGKSND